MLNFQLQNTKLLFCADVHGNRIQFDKIFSYLLKHKISTAAFGGDLTPKSPSKRTVVGQRKFLEEYFAPKLHSFSNEYLKMHGSLPKLFIVFGNDDFKSNVNYFRSLRLPKSIIVLNNDIFDDEEREISFVGYSSVPVTPFRYKDWEKSDCEPGDFLSNRQTPPSKIVMSEGRSLVSKTFCADDFSKETIFEELSRLFSKCKYSRKILICHAPPKDTCLDMLFDERHVGSSGVRKSIEQHGPTLSFHGHIHETVEMSGSHAERVAESLCSTPGNNFNSANPFVLICSLQSNRSPIRIHIK